MKIQFTMVNYHFITYFGFLLVFFGGLDFELVDVVGLISELVSSVDRIGPLLYNFPKLDIFSVKFRFLLHRIVHKKSFHTVLTIF